jgi:hypothetical protein
MTVDSFMSVVVEGDSSLATFAFSYGGQSVRNDRSNEVDIQVIARDSSLALGMTTELRRKATVIPVDVK